MKKHLQRFIGILFTFFTLNGMAAVSTEEIDITGYDLALTPWSHGRLVELATYTSSSPLRYPSYKQSMQFMLFFDESATTGLYVQTQDPAASITDWEIVNVGASKKLRIHFYKSPQPVVVQTTITIDPGKPWIAAAEKYKTWAFQQFWAKRKISPFESVKVIALGASNYFEWMMNPDEGNIALFLDKFDNEGVPTESPATAVWLTQWRVENDHPDNFNVGFPHYTPAPPSGGKSFAAVLQDLHDRGSIPMPYVNAQLWDKEMLSPTESTAHDYSVHNMVKDSSGNIVHYDPVSLPNLQFVCPSVPVWQDIILHARDNKMNDTSAVKSQGVYYDMLASAPPELCFNSTHAHSGGDPDVWVERYREMLEATEGVVMVEGSAEVYIDLADVFLMHEDTQTVGAAGIRAVPLWNAVYGTISRIAGWKVNALEENEGNIIAELKTARAFGSRTWGSPWFNKDAGNPLDFQGRLREAGYGTVMSMISADPKVLEDGSTLDVGRWQITGNIANVYDADYGKPVIQLTGTGIAHTAPEWSHAGYTQARWSVKRSNPDDMISGFKVTTVSGKTVFLYYNDSPATASPSMTHSTHYYVYHGIGIAPSANGWQIIDRDLEADLRNVLPLETIAQVKSFLIFNNPGRVTDVKLFPRHP